MTDNTRVVTIDDQLSCDVDGEAVVLNFQKSKYYGLDPVGASVWNLMDKPVSVGDICAAVIEEYDVEAERCRQDMIELLTKLHNEGLIEICGE